ncbi:nicotinate phosphoribosyltransferase [Mycoplasmopsis caviae]|uniref:Nicotinate phosphoribosyltransferase n=1 Tax=Mycoplasmopsis caviae TaxID=55603 RepID=A0A3P8LBM3_9BACT|nr:hypothetical protein [Mycoplasmopsis caviae]VDR42561.1 nicotinate phosphoribosyltransferase [Mycoplasmopsis caviae]
MDYHNNVIEQALESYKVLGNKLWGVRIDTSKNMVDHMFDNQEENPEHYGVNIEQVKNLRSALDKVGANDVKIVVSSGFNAAKIKKFEEADTPVDSYGVGAGIFKFVSSFSADAVLLNGKKKQKRVANIDLIQNCKFTILKNNQFSKTPTKQSFWKIFIINNTLQKISKFKKLSII